MHTPERLVGLAALVAAAALLIVGGVSGEIARHTLQALPLAPAAILGLGGRRAAKWAGLPVFFFWFAIMALIWLYLLGISRIVTGTYSPVETAMTVVIGLACAIGFVACHFVKDKGKPVVLVVCLVLFGLQVAVMAASMRAPFVRDSVFLSWLRGG